MDPVLGGVSRMGLQSTWAGGRGPFELDISVCPRGQAVAWRTVVLLSHAAPSPLSICSLPSPEGSPEASNPARKRSAWQGWWQGEGSAWGLWADGQWDGGQLSRRLLSRDLGLAGDGMVPVARGVGAQNFG